MATAGYNALEGTNSLKYGDYDVTQDWMFASNPMRGTGGANYLVFNPNDPNQKFATENLGQLAEYLTLDRRAGEVSSDQFAKYFGNQELYNTDNQTYFKNLFNTQTLEQIAEEKRLAGLAAQIQSGQVSREQGNTLANQEAGSTYSNPADNVYNTAEQNAEQDQRDYQRAGEAKTKMVDGVRVDINTGQPVANQGDFVDAEGNPQEGLQPTAQAPFVFGGQNLSIGSRGTAVSQLQSALGGLTVDGIFGPKTKEAVRQFQLAHGLVADGIVGVKTMEKLNALGGSTSGSTLGSVLSGMSSAKSSPTGSTARSGGTSGVNARSSSKDLVPDIGNPVLDALLEKLNSQSPQKSFSDVYKQVYKDLGIDTMKTAYEKSTKEWEKLQNEKNDAIQNINNDPWLTEGVRVQKLRQLDAKYEGKEMILSNKMKLVEGQLAEARDQAQFITGMTMEQLQQSSRLNQDVILKAIDLAESQQEAERNLMIEMAKNTAKEDKLLSPTEAAVLGVPYGTTESEAAQLGIVPDRYKDPALTPQSINSTVNGIAGAFDNEPIVKNYNTVQEGYQTISKIGVNTTSPADDIAFIYAFAKIMDPNSVVREGEYNTIQKYAQTWADNFGFSAKRIFSNTNFLTPQAKQNMLNALAPRVQTITNQYDSLYSEYQRQINDAYAGAPRQITDYSKPFSGGGGSTTGDSIWNW